MCHGSLLLNIKVTIVLVTFGSDHESIGAVLSTITILCRATKSSFGLLFISKICPLYISAITVPSPVTVTSISKVVPSFGPISVMLLHVSVPTVHVSVISLQSNVPVCIGSENVAINFTDVPEVGLCCVSHVVIVTCGLLASKVQPPIGQYLESPPVQFPVLAISAKNQLLRIPLLLQLYWIFLYGNHSSAVMPNSRAAGTYDLCGVGMTVPVSTRSRPEPNHIPKMKLSGASNVAH